MVQAADFCDLPDLAGCGKLERPEVRGVLVEREVGARLMVRDEVTGQDSAQVSLAQDENMVEALAPDRADQAFRERILIGRGDGYEIPPGHEVRVIGDEPWESVEFASAHMFGLAPEELGERVVATVIFTDIVGSTAALEHLGDHAWASVLHEHNVRIRAAIDRFRGREVTSTGDGFLALFDGASRAVRAAALMEPAVAELGIRVRVGLHTSEIEIVGGQPRGVGVHAAARVAALAGPGEVLLTGTTRDLLDGSGLILESRGEHELKGLSGARTIFALRR